MQDGLAVKEAAQALPPQHIRCSTGQPTLGHASCVSSLTAALDVCADMMEVEHSAKYTLSAHVWVAQNLWPTTPGEAVWHAQVRQRRGMAFSLWPRLTTGFESDTCDFLSELTSSSNICPLPFEENVSAVANEVTPVPQNLCPTTPGEAIWHAHVRHRRGMSFSLWPRVTTGVQSHTCDSLSEFIPGSNVCPLPCEETVSGVATHVTPEVSQWAQRWPPALPDNRFAQDRSQRMYVCDNCENRVAWRGQAQGFDGQYWAYNNNSPVASLHEQWERGRDFRWYCTACYASWWNMTDFTEVREALHLEH